MDKLLRKRKALKNDRNDRTVFVYTTGFAATLWKEVTKPGSLAVFLLAISIVVLPFFSVLK